MVHHTFVKAKGLDLCNPKSRTSWYLKGINVVLRKSLDLCSTRYTTKRKLKQKRKYFHAPAQLGLGDRFGQKVFGLYIYRSKSQKWTWHEVSAQILEKFFKVFSWPTPDLQPKHLALYTGSDAQIRTSHMLQLSFGLKFFRVLSTLSKGFRALYIPVKISKMDLTRGLSSNSRKVFPGFVQQITSTPDRLALYTGFVLRF